MLPEELCKPLLPDDFWLNYLKSNFYYSNGHVYRKDRPKPIGTINPKGYRIVMLGPLKNRNEKINFKVHILCWYLYWGIWPESEIDHIDLDRGNNSIDNLRTISRKENLERRKIRKTEDPF